MKIRNGFVSNSSSSSFIIAFKDEPCPHCGRAGSEIVDSIKYNEQDDECVQAEGKGAIVDYLREWYPDDWFTGKETGDKIIKAMAKAEKSGKKVCMIRINYHTTLHEKLQGNEYRGVEVLWRDEA